jgi:outer membrane protein assembly factor BamA
VDATVSNLSATPASGGVAATTASGDEIYASAQIVGTSLIKEGDLGIFGVRFADTATSTRYGIDINTRYPISRAVRINPRLRVTYRTDKNDKGTQISARPSLRLNIYANRMFSLEFEGGAEWQKTDMPTTSNESWDYYVNIGYRLDF